MKKPDSSLSRRELVEKALNQARPLLAMHGGGVRLIDVTKDGVVKVALQGHCVGCSLSTITLRLGIERLLISQLPDLVTAVQEV